MAKDLICGMDVDEETALRSEYKGQTYYFCSPACKPSVSARASRLLIKIVFA